MTDYGTLGFEFDVCRFRRPQQVDDVGVQAGLFLGRLNA